MRYLIVALALVALSAPVEAQGTQGNGQASEVRHPVHQSTSTRYRYVRVPRQEINDVGQNLRLRSDYILRRQQLELRRDSQINVLRSEIQRQRFNSPVGSTYGGYGARGLRY